MSKLKLHATTVVGIIHNGKAAIGSDGQATLDKTVMKSTVKKVRKIGQGTILAGFAGSTADAFTLFERLEAKLETYPGQLVRAAVELAKDWRQDRYLRRLEAMLIVVDAEHSLIVTGNGDVVEAEADGVLAIGSGGNYALSAARALITVEDDSLTAEDIARRAMKVAGDICVYTNHSIRLEKLENKAGAAK